MIHKYIATVKISDPSAVSSRASVEGFTAHSGSIYVSIPEMGFEEPDLVYCRYGLSIPYLRVQNDWRVWVEPTIDDDSRFCYTGIVDCDSVDSGVSDKDQMIIQFASQLIYASTAGILYLSKRDAEEPFVLGNQLKTYCGTVDDVVARLVAWAKTGVAPGPAGGIAPFVDIPADAIEFPDEALSEKIMGE